MALVDTNVHGLDVDTLGLVLDRNAFVSHSGLLLLTPPRDSYLGGRLRCFRFALTGDLETAFFDSLLGTNLPAVATVAQTQDEQRRDHTRNDCERAKAVPAILMLRYSRHW